jgi:hypothetical protein
LTFPGVECYQLMVQLHILNLVYLKLLGA